MLTDVLSIYASCARLQTQ